MKWFMMGPQTVSEWGLAMLEKPNIWWERWDFESYDVSSASGEEKEAKDRVQSYSHRLNKLHLHNEAPIKTLGTETLVNFLVGEQIEVSGGQCVLILRTENMKTLCSRPFQPSPICVFIWLVLIYILYNKKVAISIVLSSLLWIILVNYQTSEHCRKPLTL